MSLSEFCDFLFQSWKLLNVIGKIVFMCLKEWNSFNSCVTSDTDGSIHCCLYYIGLYILVFPDGSAGKESSCQCRRRRCDPWIRKIPWRREMLTHSSFLAWKNSMDKGGYIQSMGSQRVGYDWLTSTFSLS